MRRRRQFAFLVTHNRFDTSDKASIHSWPRILFVQVQSVNKERSPLFHSYRSTQHLTTSWKTHVCLRLGKLDTWESRAPAGCKNNLDINYNRQISSHRNFERPTTAPLYTCYRQPSVLRTAFHNDKHRHFDKGSSYYWNPWSILILIWLKMASNHPLPPAPGQQQQRPVQQRERAKSTFSFRSHHSQKSSGSGNKVDLHETHQEKDSKRLHTKADPSMALAEAEPCELHPPWKHSLKTHFLNENWWIVVLSCCCK